MFSNTAIKTALRATASGAAVTLISTAFSCSLALAVESTAHKTLYAFFPHWYKDVQYAYGLPHLEQEYKERLAQQQQVTATNATTIQKPSMGVSFNAQGELVWADDDDSTTTMTTAVKEEEEVEDDTTTITLFQEETVTPPKRISSMGQLLESGERAAERMTQEVLGCAMTG